MSGRGEREGGGEVGGVACVCLCVCVRRCRQSALIACLQLKGSSRPVPAGWQSLQAGTAGTRNLSKLGCTASVTQQDCRLLPAAAPSAAQLTHYSG